MKKTSFAFAALLACSAQAFAADKNQGGTQNVYATMPVFSQIVGFGFPASFVKGNEQGSAEQYILELVPKGESVDNWTQMITLTGAKDLVEKGATPDKILGFIADNFKKSCPDSFQAANLGEFKINGFPGQGALISCGSTKAKPMSETAMVIALQGEKDFYTLQWAEHVKNSKSPLDTSGDSVKKWGSRQQMLAPVRLCARVPGEQAPYPSCLK